MINMEPAWEWHVGDPVGFGNEVGAPEVPYMGYVKRSYEETEEEIEEREKEEEQRRIIDLKHRAKEISNEAWELKKEGRLDDALIFVNRALECYDATPEPWNIKGIILDNMKRYDESLECYDNAIELKSSSQTFKHNKIICLMNYCDNLKDHYRYSEALDRISEALEIFKTTDNKEYEDEAWNMKGTLLEELARIPEAFNCYKKAIEVAGDDNEMKQTYKENRDRLLQLIDQTDLICPKCGNNVKVTDNFCLKCGTPIEEPVKLVAKNEPDSDRRKRIHDYTSNELIIDIDED